MKVCAATLQDRVGLQNLLFNPGVLTTDGCQELKDQFGAFSLSCTRLTTKHKHTRRHKYIFTPKFGFSEKIASVRDQPLPDNAALVTVVPLHVEVAIVSYGKNVRRHFPDLLVGVLADLVSCVDRQQLVWIYCNQYGACICL